VTIVVGVAAPDGIILAGDSRTTLTFGEERHRIGSDFAQKVFPICDSIGVATYGDAFIAERTIAGLMDEFVAQLDDQPRDSLAIAAEVGRFFDARLRDATAPEQIEQYQRMGYFPIGFLVAGYDSDGIGRIREVAVPGPYVEEETDVTTAVLGVAWRGQTDVIRRLIKGFDRDLFVRLGVRLPNALEDPMLKLEYRLLFPITMQDAVDLASFLIRTTIDMQRFSDGTHGQPGDVPGCGGPIRVLAVTRAGAEWVVDAPLAGATAAGVAEGGAPA